MVFHFRRGVVERLIQFTCRVGSYREFSGCPESGQMPGLILSSDAGICLAGNSWIRLREDEDDPESKVLLAIARETDAEQVLSDPTRVAQILHTAFPAGQLPEFIPWEADNNLSVRWWLENNPGQEWLALELSGRALQLLACDLLPEQPDVARKAAGQDFEALFREGSSWSAWGVSTRALDRASLIAYVGVLHRRIAQLRKRKAKNRGR